MTRLLRWLRRPHTPVHTPARPAPGFRPRLEPLEAREVPATGLLAVGADAGGAPRVTLFDQATNQVVQDFFAYDTAFAGGVRVAVGDFNGDGQMDVVTAPGAGGGPHVRVFDGRTGGEIRSFFAYDPGVTGGVQVAVGDVTGDGRADVVTGTGPGAAPHVKVFDGATGAEVRSFFAFDPAFTGGVSVAAGDVTGDKRADVVVGAGPGGGPAVKVFDGASGAEVRSFFAFDAGFTGGVNVAAADLSGDGRAEVIAAAGPGGGPAVHVYDGLTGGLTSSFFAFDPAFAGGVRVASFLTGAAAPQLLATAAGGATGLVRSFTAGGVGSDLLTAFDGAFSGGAFLAGNTLAGDVVQALAGAGVTPPAAGLPLVTVQLKPLNVNLLGLTVTSSPITVTISAQPGGGKLLGNALSATSLVNLTGVNAALNTVLASVVDLVNAGSLAVTGLAAGSFGQATATGTTPVLDLSVAPVYLDLLGAVVTTSPIHLNVSATAGDGLVLGNVLTSLTDLFNPPLPATLNLDDVNARLADLLAELNAQLPGFNAPAGSTGPNAPPPAGGREVLSLSVPPIDLNLLGLRLTTDQIDVNADAVTGDGKLLGNVLTLLLDTAGATPANVATLNTQLNAILSKVIGVLNAADLALAPGAVQALSFPLQALALPNLLAATPGETAPVLDLSVASPNATTPPVAVDLLGLVVTTSNVDVQLAGTTGEGLVLGNLLYNVAHLLDPTGSLNPLGLLNGLTP
jgi:hypothetical protein